MAEVSEQTPTQDTNTSKELASPLCVVEQYKPSPENWAKIKPRILEMEKACFQDRTKTPPAFYGFEDDTLEKLFTNNDGTRHIMLLKMGDIIVGWISARPLGSDNIDPLLDYHPPEDSQNTPFAEYSADKKTSKVGEKKYYDEMAYISHVVVKHKKDDPRQNPPRGASFVLQNNMYQLLRKKGYTKVAGDYVRIPDTKGVSFAERVKQRNIKAGYTIDFAQEHEGVLTQKREGVSELLPPQEHIVVDIREPTPEETVQAEQP